MTWPYHRHQPSCTVIDRCSSRRLLSGGACLEKDGCTARRYRRAMFPAQSSRPPTTVSLSWTKAWRPHFSTLHEARRLYSDRTRAVARTTCVRTLTSVRSIWNGLDERRPHFCVFLGHASPTPVANLTPCASKQEPEYRQEFLARVGEFITHSIFPSR
jgi:hypothetical protein